MTGFTPARKKPCGVVHQVSLLKAQGAIQDKLAAELSLLCVSFRDNGVGEGIALSVALLFWLSPPTKMLPLLSTKTECCLMMTITILLLDI